MRHINYKTGFLSIIICFLFAGNTPAMAYEDKFQNSINSFQESPFSNGIGNHPQQAPPRPPRGGTTGDTPVGNGFGLLIGMSIAYGCFLFYRRKGKLSYSEKDYTFPV